jgi:PAB-dependent poly(A)-specific ribonuclease subunit 3
VVHIGYVFLVLIGKVAANGVGVQNIDQLLDMIRGKVIQEQEEALAATDRLEHELQSELENARLVRLLCKFGFINERPE